MNKMQFKIFINSARSQCTVYRDVIDKKCKGLLMTLYFTWFVFCSLFFTQLYKKKFNVWIILFSGCRLNIMQPCHNWKKRKLFVFEYAILASLTPTSPININIVNYAVGISLVFLLIRYAKMINSGGLYDRIER